jgi:hypothetical protein
MGRGRCKEELQAELSNAGVIDEHAMPAAAWGPPLRKIRALGRSVMAIPGRPNARCSMQTSVHRRGQQRSPVHTANPSDAQRRVDLRSGPAQQRTLPWYNRFARVDREHPL